MRFKNVFTHYFFINKADNKSKYQNIIQQTHKLQIQLKNDFRRLT